MGIYQYKNLKPILEDGVYIAPSAQIIGDVKLSAHVNIWFNVVIRGDINKIIIGENTNIQDLSMLHVVDKVPLLIGKNVTIGHSVVLHACTIEDSCLIGMGATILDGAVIGANSVVAAGAVVPPGKSYPANSMIMGAPAKVARELRPEEVKQYGSHYLTYIENKNSFIENLEEI